MAIGLQLQGQFSPDSPLASSLTEESFSSLINQLGEATDGWRLTGRLGEEGAFIQAQVHSGIEDLQVQLHKEGHVLLRFKSTPAGPGYHQAAVALVDLIAETWSVKWVNADKADSTGYFEHRDVAKLQQSFVEWLHGLCDFALKNPVEGCVSLDLPHGVRVEADGFFATPMGPRDKNWLEEIVADTANHVLDYYCWWNTEKDVTYYQGVALLLGWNLVVWHKPQTNKEAQVMADFVMACEKAVALQDDIELPRQAWVECCRFLGAEIPKEALKQDAIGSLGYRRGLIHYPIGLGWSLCLPGSFSQEVAGNNVWRGWFGDKEVRVRIFPLKKPGAVEDILTRYKKPAQGERLAAKNSEMGFYGVGDMYEAEERLCFEAEYLCGDTVMALAANLPLGEEAWIKGVWESVRRMKL